MANKNPTGPGNVPGSDKVGKTPGFEQEKTTKPNEGAFQSHMEETPETKGPAPTEGKEISPMELTQPSQKLPSSATLDSVLNQINTTQNTLKSIQGNLNTPNLQLKKSHNRLLDNKLTEAKKYLNSATQKLGAQQTTETKVSKGSAPVEKFLSYVTDGQNQLMEAKKRLNELSVRKDIKPTDMMQVQVKLSQAQQEIEYASILLSKVVDILKQTINIQI